MNSLLKEVTLWERDFAAVSEEQIKRFAESIGDTNPLHHDNEAARGAGLQGIIAPGVMVIGLVSATLAEKFPGAMVCQLELKFPRPLYAGSLPSVMCQVLNHPGRFMKLDVTVRNGSEIIAKGFCMLFLPQESTST